jgi:hypothetical protein
MPFFAESPKLKVGPDRSPKNPILIVLRSRVISEFDGRQELAQTSRANSARVRRAAWGGQLLFEIRIRISLIDKRGNKREFAEQTDVFITSDRG